MCPREPVEKDERVRERKINRDGQATLVSSSCAGTGNNRGWLEFNGRAAQYAPAQTTSSMFFFFLFFFFPPFLSGFSLSLSLFAVSFQRSSRPVPSRLVSSPLHSKPQNSRAYLVYSFNTSLSNRLLQLQYRATVLSRSPRTPRSLGLDGNRSSMTRFGMIFESPSRKGNLSESLVENLFQRYIWQRVMKTASIDLSF